MWTVDVGGQELDSALGKIAEMTSAAPYLPFEFTCHGMLERVSQYIQKQVGRLTLALLTLYVPDAQLQKCYAISAASLFNPNHY